jgi:cytidyltransferase-like protein
VNPFVSASFDDLRSTDIRFIEEASRLGPLTVALWSDDEVARITGAPPKFPLAERAYFVRSIRYVSSVIEGAHRDVFPPGDELVRVGRARDESPELLKWCEARQIACRFIADERLRQFPPPPACPENPKSERKKVLVTGCFDWFHTGHVRFFEEVSSLGDLYVVVGHDANIRLLKGESHPLFPQDERRYAAGSCRFATLAIVSSGDGWLDAGPEIDRLKPDVYAVNEDGDRPEKREFCARNGIEYVVLKREPKQGLTRRQSTALRGF